MKALFAEHSAKGLLASGPTVRRTGRIIDELSERAVDEALQAVARAAPVPGKARLALISELDRQLAAWFDRVEASANDLLAKARVGMNMMRHVAPTIRTDRAAQIEQFRAGWTAPIPKPWRERRPFLYAMLVALGGALIGLAVGSIVLPKVDLSGSSAPKPPTKASP